MNKFNSDDYELGYGKPPTSTQFRKGQSGNRTGRPRGTKNIKTDLLEELQEKVTLKEGERTRKVTKQRALLKTLLAKSLKGDPRAANSVIGLMARVFDLAATDTIASEPLGDDEMEVLEALVQRMVRNEPSESDAEGCGTNGEEV